MKPPSRILVCANLLAAATTTAVAQLVVPQPLPETSTSFQLLAHALPAAAATDAGSFRRNVESWAVAAPPGVDACQQPLLLAEPPRNGAVVATTFYFNPATVSVQSRGRHGSTTRGLMVASPPPPSEEDGAGGAALTLACRHDGAADMGVLAKPDGPQLSYGDGHFYACDTPSPSPSAAALFWRAAAEPLPPSCVDVTLYAKKVPGRPPGVDESSMVVACLDVREGVCIYSAAPKRRQHRSGQRRESRE